MDPRSYVTLKYLKTDFGSVKKFKDGFKKALGEQFVKMCCKKRMPLTISKRHALFVCFFPMIIVFIGETNLELKS